MDVTGTQYEIRGGGHRAVVTGVGAGLRVLSGPEGDLVESFGADERPPMGAGGVLVPWPNRTAGARFSWRGVEHELEVTEPARGHAIHGLLRRATWSAVRHGAAAVTLAADVPAARGWPQPLRVETTHAVDDTGLTVTHTVTNTGDADCPAGLGVHPYLRVGDVPVAACVLTVPAGTVVDLDDAAIPTGTHPAGFADDLRGGLPVDALDLDTPFRLDARHTDGGGGTVGELRAPDGRATRIWADATCGWVQVFTPPSPFGREGPAVAVEPMTCPPDALNSGTDLAVVAPGETWTVRWGIAGSAA